MVLLFFQLSVLCCPLHLTQMYGLLQQDFVCPYNWHLMHCTKCFVLLWWLYFDDPVLQSVYFVNVFVIARRFQIYED